jgi:2-dehydro-3-deoxy-D-gluconate 5-dehydrogenase
MAQGMFSLEGRVALVTGGNSGLGRAMALAFKEAGAKVAIVSRKAGKNTEVARELGDPAAAYELDVRDEGSVEQTVAAVVERMGQLDILVNNVGTVNRISVLEMELSEWERVIATNLTGAFLCTKHAGRVMACQGSGKIINISSGYGMVVPSKGLQVAYTASKHGLIGLTRANAVEFAPLGIQVNAILPL